VLSRTAPAAHAKGKRFLVLFFQEKTTLSCLISASILTRQGPFNMPIMPFARAIAPRAG
jgi:hypothetical protein